MGKYFDLKMIELKNKPIVVYLAYEPFGIKFLKNFIKNYEKFPSGFEHELVICFKGFNKKKLEYVGSI